MSIQISGSSIPPDGTVTAAKISSGAAGDGQVLTADGAGGAAWEAVAGGGPGYLEYVALLTQSGTDAPVATVLKNTLGGTVVWTRETAGVYRGTLANAFPQGKVVIFPESHTTASINGAWAATVEVIWNSESDLVLHFVSMDGPSDDFTPTNIEIRVYP